MAAPDTGPTSKKFTNDDVLRCFDEQHRRRVGKIELSASEITEILNSEILEEDITVTRQAVDKRLSELVGDELVRNKHGRSHLYARDTDLDDLFASPAPVGGGPAGGGGNGPTKTDTDGLVSNFLSSRGNMQVPALVLMALVGLVGWKTFQAVHSRVSNTDRDIIGALWLAVTGAGVVATCGLLAYSVLQTVTAAQNGLLLVALSWLIGFASLVAIVYYAGGVFGLSAKVAEAPFRDGEIA